MKTITLLTDLEPKWIGPEILGLFLLEQGPTTTNGYMRTDGSLRRDQTHVTNPTIVRDVALVSNRTKGINITLVMDPGRETVLKVHEDSMALTILKLRMYVSQQSAKKYQSLICMGEAILN